MIRTEGVLESPHTSRNIAWGTKTWNVSLTFTWRSWPEGIYLATTDDIQGLVAQGRTVAKTLEIARDVARKLVEEQSLNGAAGLLPVVTDRSDFAPDEFLQIQ